MTLRLTARSTFALQAAQAATHRIYGAEWVHADHWTRTNDAGAFVFDVKLADTAGTELMIRVYVGARPLSRGICGTVHIFGSDPSTWPLNALHAMQAERHDGTTLVWTQTEYKRRESTASLFYNLLPRWDTESYGAELEHLGYAPTVDGLMEWLEHLTGVRFEPVQLEDHNWHLHPATTEGWSRTFDLRCLDLVRSTIAAFLDQQVFQPRGA